jgi:hypothetical protein
VNRFDQNPLYGFAVRFTLIFALLLAPLPYLADTYTSLFGTFANVGLAVADYGARIGFRFEAPSELHWSGSWMAVLRVEDRMAHQTARMKLDVRTFSYRPIATFVALVVAARIKGRRRNAVVWSSGLALTIAVTSTLTVLAALRFGVGRVLGWDSSRLIETIYEALTTPAFTYIVPLLSFWAAVRFATRAPPRVIDRPEYNNEDGGHPSTSYVPRAIPRNVDD